MIQEKTVTKFLKNLGSKNPEGFKNLLKTLVLYSQSKLNKDQVFQIIKNSVSINQDLIENLNQNLKSENKLEVVSQKNFESLFEPFIAAFSEQYSDQIKNFTLAAFQISFKNLDEINFFSMKELIDTFFEQLFLNKDQYSLDGQFLQQAYAYFIELGKRFNYSQQNEQSVIDNDISFEQEEEVPIKKQPQQDHEEILREDQVIDAVEKYLNPFEFENFLKIFLLYSKNVISYQEFIQIAEPYLIQLDKNILQSLKNSIEQRVQSRKERNPFNLKLQVSSEKNKGFGNNISYKPFLNTTLQFKDYPERIVNKKYFCVLYGHEGGLDEQTKLHVKYVAKEELLKTEDEIHEIDITIQRVKIINSYLKKIVQNQNHPKKDLYLLKLKNMKMLNLLYGKKSNQIYELLLQDPQELLPIIVQRFEEKFIILKEVKQSYHSKWRKIMENNYYKSLDEKSISLKNKEQKLLSTKKLLLEMENQEKLNKKKTKYLYVYKSLNIKNINQKYFKIEIPQEKKNSKFWNPINAFQLVDVNILNDIAQILISYIKQVKSNQNEINLYIQTIKNFIINFFKIEELKLKENQQDQKYFESIDLQDNNELIKETKQFEIQVKGDYQFLYSDKFKIQVNENKMNEMLELISNLQNQEITKKSKNNQGIEEQFYSAIKSNNESSEEFCQEMQIKSQYKKHDNYFFGSFQFYMIYKYFSFACERFNFVKNYSQEKCNSDELYKFFIKSLMYSIHSVIDNQTYEDIMRAVFQKSAGSLMNFERIFSNIFKNYKEDDFTKFVVQENSHSLGDTEEKDIAEELIFAKTCYKLNKINRGNQKVSKTNFQIGQSNYQQNQFFKFQYLSTQKILVIHKMRSIYSNEYIRGFSNLNQFLEEFETKMIENNKQYQQEQLDKEYFMQNNINYMFQKRPPYIGFFGSSKEDIYFTIDQNKNLDQNIKKVNKKQTFDEIRKNAFEKLLNQFNQLNPFYNLIQNFFYFKLLFYLALKISLINENRRQKTYPCLKIFRKSK